MTVPQSSMHQWSTRVKARLDVDLEVRRLHPVGERERVLARDVVPGRDQLGLEAVRQGVRAVVADAPDLVEPDALRPRRRVHHHRVPDVEVRRVLLEHGPGRAEDLLP